MNTINENGQFVVNAGTPQERRYYLGDLRREIEDLNAQIANVSVLQSAKASLESLLQEGEGLGANECYLPPGAEPVSQ